MASKTDGETGIRPYGGYFATELPREDEEVARIGPRTACGEYFRRYWHPVALASRLEKGLPVPLRILGEDLVLFRDGSGRVGLLHRHCSHRGASLEFGIINRDGIRCCYHGWLYGVDGTILETPGEPDNSPLRHEFCHGAYPVREYKGLIFAYFGHPDRVPEFPIFDVYNTPDNRMLPYCIEQPCNWLQVQDNGIDPIHTVFLHSRVAEVQLGAIWGEMPTLDYHDDDHRVYYISARRAGKFIWTRSAETIFPNIQQTGALWWDHVDREIIFSRVSLTRWNVPIDDTNTLLIGWRHFNELVDPDHLGREDLVGFGTVDFVGQTGERSYEERQRNPGDFDAQVSQRPIAIHALEKLGTTDRGVVMMRRHLRRAIRGEIDREPLRPVGGEIPTVAHDTVVEISADPRADDRKLLHETGRAVVRAIKAGHGAVRGEREELIRRTLAHSIAALRQPA